MLDYKGPSVRGTWERRGHESGLVNADAAARTLQGAGLIWV